MADKTLFYEEVEVNTKDIRVPHDSYQRGLNITRVNRIADNFDERIANKPKLSYRDGKFYVFDGQHTIAARKKLNKGNDLLIACKVYYGLTEQEEALLFAQQFGFSDPLTAGVKIRALIYGGDPEAVAFLNATESAGFNLDYAQNLGENRLGCISTAFRAFQRVGEESYTEGLHIVKEAWNGEPHSLRGEIVRAVIEFVNLYKDEYNRDRLVSKLQMVDPLTIYRKGQDMGIGMAGYKKYLYQVYTTYNGACKKAALPLKF